MPAPPLSIPEAWRRLRLPGEPPARDGVTFCSPFRYDKHPGCFLDRHLTGYCDFGAGINTGLIGFIALGLDLPHESEVRARLENGWMRQTHRRLAPKRKRRPRQRPPLSPHGNPGTAQGQKHALPGRED
jgi:hypothetical protein